jgi:2-amino-4-hydroxy-6-hydroxymethyldihydropteridine diphosphokinase
MPEGRPNRAYLSLGSNIEPERNLPASVALLRDFGTPVAVSRVWQSPPQGFADQADFLNAAVLLETGLSAAEIVADLIPAVERRLGRVRDPHNKNAPRTIDVDLSLFNRDVLTVAGRPIPDPQILARDFVAVPLAEIDPDYVHPTDGRTLAQIAAGMPSRSRLRLRRDLQLG